MNEGNLHLEQRLREGSACRAPSPGRRSPQRALEAPPALSLHACAWALNCQREIDSNHFEMKRALFEPD